MAPKIVIVGFDGACWQYMDPWLEAGELPNLKRLIEKGSRGVLRSTIPPVSPVAWTSIFTGVNPGKHGIFDWKWIRNDSRKLTYATGKEVKAVSLWDILADYGLKAGIINVPMTFPPEKISGFLISGMDTPKADVCFSYPENLLDYMEKMCGKYIVFPEPSVISSDGIVAYLDIWKSAEDVRMCTAINLMKKIEVDLLFIVLQITDFINHFTKNKNILLEAYKNADKNLGKLLEFCSKNTTVFVISDHGNKIVKKEFCLNVWLEKKGLLHFKSRNAFLYGEDAHVALRKLLSSMGMNNFVLFEKIIRNILTRVLTKRSFLSRTFWQALCRYLPEEKYKLSNIDWQRTRAFLVSKYGSIYLLPRGKKRLNCDARLQQEKLMKSIISELKTIKDPMTNKRLFGIVLKKEEYIKGKYASDAPDIVVFPSENDYMISESTIPMKGPLLRAPSLPFVGDHSMKGVVVISGKHILKGEKILDANIYDIVPTILYLLNIPIPGYLDGRILKECISNDYSVNHKEKYIEKEFEKKSKGSSQSKREAEEMKDRLKSLGYIG